MSNDNFAPLALNVFGVVFMAAMVLGIAWMFYDMGRKK